MANINQVFTLGIGNGVGTGDIEHFVLVGLSASSEPPPPGSSTYGMRYRWGQKLNWTHLWWLLLAFIERRS